MKYKVENLFVGTIVYNTGYDGLYYSPKQLFIKDENDVYHILNSKNKGGIYVFNNDIKMHTSVTDIEPFDLYLNDINIEDKELSARKANWCLTKYNLKKYRKKLLESLEKHPEEKKQVKVINKHKNK